MATGGTIPTNRTQSVTFYNTTAIIEREKNIYYVPRFSKIVGLTQNTEVRQAYLTAFNGVCSSSSDYSNIVISGWSPQDRTLVVQGNIDDFRLVTDVGKCLNYFIISRTITTGSGESEVSKTYYYGFFITGVQQAGGSSIRITCEPDDFTNVFYLHNTHKLTTAEISGDYEPFNENMKNCYVNRQHYNRVKFGPKTVSKTITASVSLTQSNPHITPSQIVYTAQEGEEISNVYFVVETQSGSGIIGASISDNNIVVTGTGITLNTTTTATLTITFDSTTQDGIVPDNIKVFLNQEESFKFKYQFRDFKYPVSIYDGNFTENEIETINDEDNFSSLSSSLRNKILLSCISYICLEYKSREGSGVFAYSYTADIATGYLTHYATGNLVKSVNKPNLIISLPTFIIPEYFTKYSSAINEYYFYEQMGSDTLTLGTVYDICKALCENAMADKILSVFVVKDINIPKNKITITHSPKAITYTVVNMFDLNPQDYQTQQFYTQLFQNVYCGLIRKEYAETDFYKISLHKVVSPAGLSYNSDYLIIGLISSGYDKTDFTVNIKETIPDLMSNYFDPVLETEPYEFYSISTLGGFELPFNRNRYYTGLSSDINLSLYTEINEAVKVGLIPSYTVEGIETKYFNEALIFTTNSGFTLTSDSYASFYYQNKAQMKNQFAVNGYNQGADFLQHFFVSGPNAVGYSAGSSALGGGKKAGGMAGYSALLETGNQVMQMVNEAGDMFQSHHVIEMNQKALKADMGAKPDTVKQIGSDVYYDLKTDQNCYFLNHYAIDELSYNSIAKLLERSGYQVNLYDNLNVVDRVGWNFIKLNGFDFNPVLEIMTSQEDTIRTIFANGVTLLHDKSFLTSGHNYETILEGGE